MSPGNPVTQKFSPLIAGCLLTTALLLIGGAGVLPWSLASAVALCTGGLVAGLLTEGSGWDGALAGIPPGVLLVAGTALRSLGDFHAGGAGGGTGIMAGMMSSVVIPAAFFIPSTAIGGAVGGVARRIAVGLTFPDGATGDAVNRAAWRLWAGIIAGALLIPVSVFSAGSLSFLLLLPPFTGGLVAGLAATGTRRGAGSGFLAGILGIGLLAIPVVWMSSQATGFVAGLGWIVLLVMSLFSLPAATAGGTLGGSLAGALRAFPPVRRPGP